MTTPDPTPAREFTPPFERLRDEYVQMRAEHYGFSDLYAAEFDRALAQRDARIRRETFAEVSRAMNRVADMWEKDGSDPCRVRVERELANAYRAYAEGFGEPTGSRHP